MRSLKENLVNAEELMKVVSTEFGGFDFGGDYRAQVAGGLSMLTFCHAVAMLRLLAEEMLRPSAFALARPLTEAAAHCLLVHIPNGATANEMKKYEAGKRHPFGNYSRVLARLRGELGKSPALIDTGIENLFSSMGVQGIEITNGFLHGGIEQTSRFGDSEGWLKATHSDDDCSRILILSMAVVTEKTMTILLLNGRAAAAIRVLSKARMLFPPNIA